MGDNLLARARKSATMVRTGELGAGLLFVFYHPKKQKTKTVLNSVFCLRFLQNTMNSLLVLFLNYTNSVY